MNPPPLSIAPWGDHPLPEILRGPVAWSRRMPANWLGQRLALAVRHRSKRLGRGPLDVEALGVRLRLFPEDNFCENRLLFMPQFYDPQEFRFLARVLGPTSSFVDIGANIGIYTLVVARHLAPQGRVLAIEPDPVTFLRLQTNLQLNGLTSVVARQLAVGDRPGVLHLHREAGNRGQNELRTSHDAHSEAVTVHPLSSLFTESGFEAPEVMKIDIEGMEETVLQAFFATMPANTYPQHLVVEEKPSEPRAALRSLLASAGYRKIEQTPTNGIWRRN